MSSQSSTVKIGDLTKAQMLKIARNLQAGYSKDQMGAPRGWAEIDKRDQEAWIRTARRAVKLLREADTAGKPDSLRKS